MSTSARIRKRPNRLVTCLLNCVVFLVIVCTCLLTMLVLVGRHIMNNSHENSQDHFPPKNTTPVAERSFKRLPGDTRPIFYDISLFTDLIRSIYKGSVNITLKVYHPRNDLVIHSKELLISKVILTNCQGEQIRILKVSEVVDDQVIIITTQQRVLPGLYHLFLNFNGKLLNRLWGYYRTIYTKSGKESR